jgi:hypothetical protein
MIEIGFTVRLSNTITRFHAAFSTKLDPRIRDAVGDSCPPPYRPAAQPWRSAPSPAQYVRGVTHADLHSRGPGASLNDSRGRGADTGLLDEATPAYRCPDSAAGNRAVHSRRPLERHRCRPVVSYGRARLTTACSAASRHRPGSHLSSGRCGTLSGDGGTRRGPDDPAVAQAQPESALPATTRWQLGKATAADRWVRRCSEWGDGGRRTSRLPGAGGSV